MGAWGDGPFDNDTAADWSHDFAKADMTTGMQLIEDALGGGDPDLATAAMALVAHIAGESAVRTVYNADALAWAWEARENPLMQDWARSRMSG